MEGDLLNILQAVAEKFGIGWGGILAAAGSLVVITNFLKATSPFNKFIYNSRVPYVIGILSLGSGAFSYWGHWLQAGLAAALTTVVAIGGWATAKMLAHKAAQPVASNPSGGAPKPTKPTA